MIAFIDWYDASPRSLWRLSRCDAAGALALSTGARGRIESVPTISRFYGIVIAMYFDDHGFPHFQARHARAGAKV